MICWLNSKRKRRKGEGLGCLCGEFLDRKRWRGKCFLHFCWSRMWSNWNDWLVSSYPFPYSNFYSPFCWSRMWSYWKSFFEKRKLQKPNLLQTFYSGSELVEWHNHKKKLKGAQNIREVPHQTYKMLRIIYIKYRMSNKSLPLKMG